MYVGQVKRADRRYKKRRNGLIIQKHLRNALNTEGIGTTLTRGSQ